MAKKLSGEELTQFRKNNIRNNVIPKRKAMTIKRKELAEQIHIGEIVTNDDKNDSDFEYKSNKKLENDSQEIPSDTEDVSVEEEKKPKKKQIVKEPPKTQTIEQFITMKELQEFGTILASQILESMIKEKRDRQKKKITKVPVKVEPEITTVKEEPKEEDPIPVVKVEIKRRKLIC